MDIIAARASKHKSYMAPDLCRRGDLIKYRFEVMEKLGAGSFGQVYKVRDLQTDVKWAMKVEAKTAKKPVLRMDVAITRALIGKTHIAQFFACGHEERFSYMVTQQLGRNLSNRKRATSEGRFSLRSVVRIIVQALEGIRDLHQSGYVHRDIKPSNMATGVGEYDKVVYLIDFGLARKYLDDKGRIYAPRPKANFRGTVRYASPGAHGKQELSRGDDLWSLFYTMIDLFVGRLPWHDISEMRRVGRAKISTRYEELYPRGFSPPRSWLRFYAYCREMQYEAIPDYDYLIQAVNDLLTKPVGIIDLKQLTTAPWEWESDMSTKS